MAELTKLVDGHAVTDINLFPLALTGNESARLG